MKTTANTTAKVATEPNFKTDQDQLVDFFGHGIHTVKYLGKCPVSGIRMYDMPGCPYPDHDYATLVAEEYGYEGADFIYSWVASNTSEMYKRALALAKAQWTGKPAPTTPAAGSPALAIIGQATVTAESVTLPKGQLDRKVYEEVKKYLEAAGGKWNTSKQAFLFKRDPREQIAVALETGKVVSTKKETQAFYTPTELVDTMLSHLGKGINPDLSGLAILEPSAGEGAIADALQAAGANVVCVEYDKHSAKVLNSKGHNVVNDDFLNTTPCATFDSVLMNPPFTKGQDMKHVSHAYAYLKPGGTLLAIMSPAFTTVSNKAADEFRQLVARSGGVVERFEAGAFKESGTNVSTVLVKLTKSI